MRSPKRADKEEMKASTRWLLMAGTVLVLVLAANGAGAVEDPACVGPEGAPPPYRIAQALEQCYSEPIAIQDATVVEGNDGTATITFTVVRRGLNETSTRIDYQTADGSALAGQDYQPTSGSLNFSPTDPTTQVIQVRVNADRAVEGDETFFMWLVGPPKASLSDPRGIGTIRNDDSAAPPPGPPLAARASAPRASTPRPKAPVSGIGSSAPAVSPSVAPEAPVQADQPGPVVSESPDPDVSASPMAASEGGSDFPWIWIVVLLAIAAAGGAGGWVFVRTRGPS
jgi:hypothetical protein